MTTLITGAAGYLGSHTLVSLLDLNKDVIALDDLSRSTIDQLNKVSELTGKQFEFIKCSILDPNLSQILKDRGVNDVIHFAGLKSVSESTHDPMLYYQINVQGTINLLRSMEVSGINKLIFSSSCTVYGNQNSAPYFEDMILKPVSPYGSTKLICEKIISDWVNKSPNVRSAISLRYFNPIGAHPSGIIGEIPNEFSNNIMPHLLNAAKNNSILKIFGNDYDTRDGTGERDYIHVMDLAKAHIAALDKNSNGHSIFNIGTGNSTTVLELIEAFERVTNLKLRTQITNRRSGDVARAYANVAKAEEKLQWRTEFSLKNMLEHAWKSEIIRESQG